MRTKLVWLFVGAALASVGILVIPAFANTLSNSKAEDKAEKWARAQFNRDADYKRRTRANAYQCKRQDVEGSQDPDPHRIACRVHVRYYWEGLNGGNLPPDVYRCTLVRKSHSNGNVTAGPGSGC